MRQEVTRKEARATGGGKGFNVWPVSLVFALFLFGALGGAIQPKKETKEIVQASATPPVQERIVVAPNPTPALESATGTVAASRTPTATPVEQPAATPSSVATPKPTVAPRVVTTPSPTPKPGPLRKINNDVLGAYSKEGLTEMLDLYTIHDIDGVKQMVSEGKVVGLRKGALVSLEDVDVRDRIVKVRPKGSSTTIWIPSQFLD